MGRYPLIACGSDLFLPERNGLLKLVYGKAARVECLAAMLGPRHYKHYLTAGLNRCDTVDYTKLYDIKTLKDRCP
jgi:hypothetical protein